MKYKLLGLLLLIAIGSYTKAQTLTEKEIIGTWKVNNVLNMSNEIKEDQRKLFDTLKKIFINSKFIFTESKNSSFDINNEELKISKAHWKFGKIPNSIVLQEWKDKDTDKWILMEITIEKVNDKIYFIISESFLKLEMKRD